MKVFLYGLLAMMILAVPCRVLAAAEDSEQSLTMQAQAGDDLFDDLYADDEDELTADPLEMVNRGVFWFNDKLYVYLLKPVAKGLRIIPQPVRSGVANIFDNLKSPLRAINSLLQLKFSQAATETGRLVVNSTLGLAGYYDPAKTYWDLNKKDEDFGQTLGYYGIGKGFYLVLPIFGASTLRDGVSMIPDGYADPLFWTVRSEVLWGLRGTNIVNRVSLDKDTYESIVKEQLDPYLFIRDAYLQKRQAKIDD
ncbi:MAG: VacJ family lipoprotein [Desulfuromonas sp.]|nr:VacJ family lipoprotein [Desulfuromonas sp.]